MIGIRLDIVIIFGLPGIDGYDSDIDQGGYDRRAIYNPARIPYIAI
jgi:hypothetical protein